MPWDEFAVTFSGAVLKVTPAESPSQTAGEDAAYGEEILTESVALGTAAVPFAEAVLLTESDAVEPEAPITDQDPAADAHLTSQPAMELV
jgi:hypothetical protein